MFGLCQICTFQPFFLTNAFKEISMQTSQSVQLNPIAKFFAGLTTEIEAITPEELQAHRVEDPVGEGEVVLGTLPKHLQKLFAFNRKLAETSNKKLQEFTLLQDEEMSEEAAALRRGFATMKNKHELLDKLFWFLLHQEDIHNLSKAVESDDVSSIGIRDGYQLVTIPKTDDFERNLAMFVVARMFGESLRQK